MKNIPLNQLIVSEKYNVRKTNADKGLEELTASIKAHGLLENLVVIKGDNDNYEVIAGGRRLRALNILHQNRQLNDNNIPCEVVDSAHAEEISMAENMVRTRMHPADEYEAWAKLVDDGMSVGDIAARFGVSDATVSKRLKLGRVSPKLMQAYRDNQLSIECLMAYTLTEDHSRQEQVFDEIKDTWEKDNSRAVRSYLTDEFIKGDHKIAQFVGVEAYERAGGYVRKDLFSSDDARSLYFENTELLEKLAAEKLQQKADEVQKEQWKWVSICFDLGYEEKGQYNSIAEHQLEEVPEELTAQHDALEESIDELEESPDRDEKFLEEQKQKLKQLELKINSYFGYTEEEKAIAGCIVTLNYSGEYLIHRGLVKPEDKRAFKKMVSNDETDQVEVKKEKPLYSSTLEKRLKNYRLHPLKMALSKDFEAAFDAALYVMACGVFKSYQSTAWLEIRNKKYNYPEDLSHEDPTCIAFQEKEEKFDKKLPLDWIGISDPVEQFEAFCKLSQENKQKLFAACVAKGLMPKISCELYSSPVFEFLGKRLKVDVAKAWRPNEENFLKRISKADLLTLGNDLLGASWFKAHHKKTKAQIVGLLDKAFNEPDKKKLKKDVLEKLSNWLPEHMGF